jgi:hypothetical protein
MNIINRIKEIADNENITITALEKKIGASKGVLSRALKTHTDIQSKWLTVIVENYPQYNTRWLLTGEGKSERIKTDIVNKDKDNKNELDIIQKLSAENALLKRDIEDLKKMDRRTYNYAAEP